MKCYLVTNRHQGCFGKNWLLFWGPDNKGYSNDIRTAGIYEVDSKTADYPILTSKKATRAYDCYGDYYIPCSVLEKDFHQFNLIEV